MDRTDLTFPANDGGLFYSMIRDLQANAFRLPQYASYNGGSIPFAYPPLGFYLAGALDVTMPVSLEALLAYLPLAINLFVGLAAYSLAWELFGSRWTALASAAAWYLLPDSARFLVMGGGLTRSLGLLWAVLAIHSAHRMYARGSARDALATAALSALALATHLEMAWFAAWAIASLALVKVRSWRTAALSAGAALGALALSTPWWGTVIARHGPDVFLGTLSGSAGEWPWTYALSMLMRGGMHNELLPVISVIGLCGAVLAVHRRQYWLPIWLLVVFLTAKRGPSPTATVPLALLAGYALVTWIAPNLARVRLAVGGLVCVSVLLIALLDHILVNAPVLTPLSEGERQVMVSLADDIGPEARVLVLPTDDWAADRSSEWFPALSGLVSVATVQGSEWLPNGEFTRRIDAHDALLNCVYTADTTCLQEWIEGSPIPVDYIYVPQHEAIERAPYVEPGTPACTSIEASIHREGQYRLVLSSPAAHVYAVAPFPAP